MSYLDREGPSLLPGHQQSQRARTTLGFPRFKLGTWARLTPPERGWCVLTWRRQDLAGAGAAQPPSLAGAARAPRPSAGRARGQRGALAAGGEWGC